MNWNKTNIQFLQQKQSTHFLLWQKAISLFVLFGLFLTVSTAQPTLQFQNFTQKHGLASNDVVCIHQDHLGFIWIGTENGLNRFDGKHFLTFRFDPEDPETLNDNWIWTLFEDSRYNLWIGTQRGLNRLNRKTGKIERIPLIKEGRPVIDIVKDLIEDPSGNLWITTATSGLFQVKPSDNKSPLKAIHFAYNETFTNTKESIRIYNLVTATSNELWISTSAGLDQLFISTGKITRYPFPDRVGLYDGETVIMPGILSDDGKIFIGSDNQFYVLDLTDDSPRLTQIKTIDSSIAPEKVWISSLILDSPGILLYASSTPCQ